MLPGFPKIPFRPTLPALLHRAVERYGDNDFVVMTDQRISFAQAEQASAALARRLVAAGAGKGTRIGVILPSGVDWVVAWLAIARIGAISMLLPATYRPAELQRALRISDAAFLIAGRTLLGKDYEAFLEEAVPTLRDHDRGPIHDAAVPFLRSIWMVGGSDRSWATRIDPKAADEISCGDDLLAAIESEVTPADPLLVIYTSGSTADPKAIIHTHGATIRKIQPELDICLPASRGGRTFCAMPFFWVGGPQDLLGALLSGAAVVTQERFEPAGALDLLERERCDSIVGWPTAVDQIRSQPDYAQRDLSALSLRSVRYVFSSRGDPVNGGMTETFGPHANPDWFDYKIVNRESGRTLPDGEVGEFCVRGFGVMAGMYKKEREETFDSDGYYHTGDRGYIENGDVFFCGRYSEMIKSGGANVSPLEVESVLQSFAEVDKAIVLGVPDDTRGELVVAVVVPAKGMDLDVNILRELTNRNLSSYKVPVRWLMLHESEIPLLPSGKVDKLHLRKRFE
jgi:acyl-CoA synthetase (AMP-forming)/AMP-acid ligase II